ncbi:HIRAN domain-containing protein [Xylanibacillus composti]|uniref:HIRAN domain-containing protein n=1 Tax=Xylanibacillus composti TaxID=1572762 RepID=A0A8J4H124_9BACL|nr:HIRAN domain-containing protein [Xylanibacillus composti]GIQ68939.1 hypothetical protein XYCOK13_17630 [Xylanibacillus composti]
MKIEVAATTEVAQEKNFREFTVNIAGITYENDDGSSRIKIAKSCRAGQKLNLVRDPDNPHDKNAVKIMTEDGRQLGFLDASTAAELQATLKGTSNTFSSTDAAFVESGEFENDRRETKPYAKILVRKYYKSKTNK